MELAEIPELDMVSSSCEVLESGDSFVVDMDSFSSTINKDIINANSRTTLQRSLSRKGSQRWNDRNVNGCNVAVQDKDIVPTTCSPKASLLGPSKSTVMAVGSIQNSINTQQQQVHHQITITTASSNMCNNTNTENKCMTTRRNSFGRSYSWLLDPKKILLIFATLSSVGTLLLIYLTLSISKHNNGVEYGSDLQ
ncbi:uncharacterized protein LOC131643438 [Vicia villosa]|uniref:uncharacterized protein LOC131643438 n=1 Tax=Vicia villosa TaxID=3911 RepID=UPI00273C90F0|nr:uncharacterized protein LOC131643438 [Vicia villosa]